MKKKMQKFLSLVLALVLSLSMTTIALAEEKQVPEESKVCNYVALGDSIPAFYGVEAGEGYVELLAKMLAETKGVIALNNIAVAGDDSTDLLALVKDKEKAAIIKDADLITISIGGNNLLGSLFSNVSKILEEKTNAFAAAKKADDDKKAKAEESKTEEAKAEESKTEETKAEESKTEETKAEEPEIVVSDEEKVLIMTEVIAEINELMNDKEFIAELGASYVKLTKDIPAIITEIKKLAPNAEIYFATVYNPLSKEDSAYAAIDAAITGINKIIIASAGDSYKIVDAYAAYREVDGKDSSNIDFATGNLDPHPNKVGHELLAKVHFDTITAEVEGEETVEVTLPTEVKELTRAEAVAELVNGLADHYAGVMNTENLTLTEITSFADVDETHPQFTQVMLAKALGLVSGVGDSNFDPDAIMTRQDFSVVVQKCIATLIHFGLMEEAAVEALELTDIDTAADYAKDSLQTTANMEILTAVEGEITPFAVITNVDVFNFSSYLAK